MRSRNLIIQDIFMSVISLLDFLQWESVLPYFDVRGGWGPTLADIGFRYILTKRVLISDSKDFRRIFPIQFIPRVAVGNLELFFCNPCTHKCKATNFFLLSRILSYVLHSKKTECSACSFLFGTSNNWLHNGNDVLFVRLIINTEDHRRRLWYFVGMMSQKNGQLKIFGG